MSHCLYAIYGVSGCGRGVMPIAREQLTRQGIPTNRLVFVDDSPRDAVVNGHRVLTYAQFLSEPAQSRLVALAIASSVIRERLSLRCIADGIVPWSVCADNVLTMDNIVLGAGSILSPFVTLTSNIQIGKYFHANLYSYVEHDCVIGDYVTFAPSVRCNGNIVIEDHVYIGAGAIIKHGQPGRPLVIGKGAIVGMGAVVTKDVPASATVVGNPAKLLLKG
jgi:sugar O-acyltransferase (sialic acid O-acetyltransferase NeuD family)